MVTNLETMNKDFKQMIRMLSGFFMTDNQRWGCAKQMKGRRRNLVSITARSLHNWIRTVQGGSVVTCDMQTDGFLSP
jgi:hypothetical protein